MLEHFGVTEANWREGGEKDSNFLESESPLFVGRAVAALAGDANVMKRSGHLFSSWELAREFGFTDADGRRPDWGMKDVDFSKLPPALCALILEGLRFQSEWLRIHSERTDRYLERWSERPGRAGRPRLIGRAVAARRTRATIAPTAERRRRRVAAATREGGCRGVAQRPPG